MRILLLEDDVSLCHSLKASLEGEGYAVTVSQDGEEGLFYMEENGHDLVLLDRMLPGRDGMEVLREARREGIRTPVIFLTALGALEDRVTGLDVGADDYVVKPFAFEELSARIRTVLRRPRTLWSDHALTLKDLTYDPGQNLLKCGEESCTLSKREGELLALFLTNGGQILPRGTILLRVWGEESEVESGNLDNYIHFLRRRLRSVHSTVTLQTIRGVGYRMC